MIHALERFEHFKGRDLNSHMPSIDAHLRMFKIFEPLRTSVLPNRLFNADEIIKIMNARRHPK